MLGLLGFPVSEWPVAWLDGFAPPDRVRRFLHNELRKFAARRRDWAADEQPATGAVLTLAARLLDDEEILSQLEGIETSPDTPPSLDQADSWIACLERERVVTRGGLAAGTGRWLDRISAESSGRWREFLRNNIELLLRHVEVKRSMSLQPVVPGSTRENAWLERHDVAILFCRHTRRSNDLRMLNAALKLNDWAFAARHRFRSQKVLARYLLALAEQERTIQEVLS